VYEEHEWLKGDGTAYIQGVTYDLWNNHLQMQIGTAVALPSSSIGYGDTSSGATLTATRNRDLAYPESYMMIVFREGTNKSHIADISYNDIPQILDLDFYIDNAIFQCIRDGVVFTTGETATESLWTSITPIIPSNKVSYIRELLPNNTYRSNLTPCRLLRPIPATLDANGIARDAGECGMWDKVSNKFYGNVASTGRFTVEGQRLYEEFDWLCGNGTAYFRIPVNIYQESLYVKFHPISSDADREFWAGFYNVSSNTIIEIRGMIGSSNELAIRFGLRENGEATTSVLIKRNIDFLSDFTIETQYSEDNKVNVTFNGSPGTATPIIDSRANKDVLVAFKTTWCRFAMVTTDRISLTPVRLLRPLPAYMDANGRPRAAGECGMWDKVSNKFYGNVATSGRFTVLNN
jgi:hypothetical protein